MILLGLHSVLCHGNPIVFCGESKQDKAAFKAYWEQEEIGWHYGFGLAGIGMAIGQLFYWRGQKYLSHDNEEREVLLQ